MVKIAPVIKQSWTVSALWLSSIHQGLLLTYPYSLLPALSNPKSPIRTDLETASWIASCTGITMVLGLLITSIALDRYGRRITHAVVLLMGIFSWLTLYLAEDVPIVFLGRLLAGFSASPAFVIGVVVIGEYTSPKYRGVFISIKGTGACLGNLIMHVLAMFFDWRTIALICIAPLVTALCINYTWPESPAWLLTRNEFEKGKEAFYYLRGTDETSVKELEAMLQAQKEYNDKRQIVTTRKKYGKYLRQFTNKLSQENFVKPLFMMIALFMLIEVSGRHIFPVYAFEIMSDIVQDRTESLLYTLVVDLVAIFSGALSCVLVRFVKRRALLFISGSISVLLLLCISLYLFLLSRKVLAYSDPWLFYTTLIVYFVFANVGCIAMPLIFFGEIFPLEHRETGTGLATAISASMIMISIKVSPSMLATLGVHGTFTVSSIIMALILFYLYFVVPETKNRSLIEIEGMFKSGQKTDEAIKDTCEMGLELSTINREQSILLLSKPNT